MNHYGVFQNSIVLILIVLHTYRKSVQGQEDGTQKATISFNMLRSIANSVRDIKCLLSANIEQSAEPPLINSISSSSVLLGMLSSLDITCQGL